MNDRPIEPRHELVLLAGMTHAIEAMLDDVARAERRVWIESYIVRNDRLGRMLGAALADAAKRGADVRLLFDALGSKHTPPEFIEELRAKGIGVELYRRLRAFPLGVFPRDHSRIVVTDDTAFTGGSAWGDEWLPVAKGGKGWHDVCLRMRGPCVADLVAIFRERWAQARGDPDGHPRSVEREHPDLTVVSDVALGAHRIYEHHLAAVARARRRIWIENSYFFPPRPLLEALTAAAQRGVDVALLLPGDTDLPSVTRAARGEYAKWLARGIRIAELQRTVLHSKIAVIDDDWCTIGTFNINPTSVACVHELNVFVTDPSFVARVAEQIAEDFSASKPLTRDDVRRWPFPRRVGRFLTAAAFRLLEALLVRHIPQLLWSKDATEDGDRDKRSRLARSTAR
jgi:cardiolipin synthase A/B